MNADNHETCLRMRDELFEAVDSGGPLPGDLREHLASCEACREDHRRLTGLVRALDEQAGPVEPLGEGFAATVMAEVGPSPVRPVRGKVIRFVRPALAAAAAALLALGVWQVLQPVQPVIDPPKHRPNNPVTATVEMTEGLMGEVAELAAGPAGDMDRVLEDAGQFGDELLASVPIDLIPGVDRAFVATLLAGSAERDAPTTKRKGHRGDRPGGDKSFRYGAPVLFPSFRICLYNGV